MKKVPSPVLLYRITHIDNFRHIIRNGLVTENSPNANPDFRQIGDSTLIDYRKNLPAPNPPGGMFKNYIPFYFGPRSPMLYQIASGWEDIQVVPQQEIIYLISTIEEIEKHKLDFFFCDGHARSETTRKYININDLTKLDWDAILSRNWKNIPSDLRRKEKKQSEILIKDFVPISCIKKIGVYNTIAGKKISTILAEENHKLEIEISPFELYYDFL